MTDEDAEAYHMRVVLAHVEELRAEIAKLKAITIHAAGFLEGMAARIENWERWDSDEDASFAQARRTQAAKDCRTLAASLHHHNRTC